MHINSARDRDQKGQSYDFGKSAANHYTKTEQCSVFNKSEYLFFNNSTAERLSYLTKLSHGNSMPRIIKNSMAASPAETGTVITQAAAIFSKAVRFTSSCR